MTEQKSILFLEDEPELLSTLGNLLRDQGYQVNVIKTAEDALKQVEQSHPDLILIDIKLPGMDGFDFFNEIRKNKALSATPVVFLTAFNDVKAMIYAKKLGAADYITKPFDFEYLVTRVRDILST